MTGPLLTAAEQDRRYDFGRVLLPDETLLWEGAPEPGFRLRGKAVFQIILGLPFLAIGVICLLLGLESLLIPTYPPVLFAIFATAFGGTGGYLVFQPIFEAYIAARHVRYALSSRAAFINTDWPVQRLEVFPILPSSESKLKRGRKVDTVWFHMRKEDGSEGGISETRIGFQNISNGAEVFHLVQGIQTKDPK